MAAANPLVTFIDEECDTLKSQQNAIRGQHELDVNNLKVRTPEVMKHMEGVLDTKLRELKVRQAITEFYYQFREWCQQEGSRWVPKKSEVERDLQNLGYSVAHDTHLGQKVVEGLATRL